MLTITLNGSQRCFFDPGPKDAIGAPAVPGVGPEYLVTDPTVASIDQTSGRPDVVPLRVGSTLVTIRGAVAPGQPWITKDITVAVVAGPFDHFEPTADPPRAA